MAGLKRGGVRVLVLCILMTSAGCCQREGDRKAPLEGSLDLGDGVVIDLVYIRPGKFMMGSDKDYMRSLCTKWR